MDFLEKWADLDYPDLLETLEKGVYPEISAL